MLAPFVFSRTLNMTKRWGIAFLGLYGAYLLMVIA
jgi:hypothetical protein